MDKEKKFRPELKHSYNDNWLSFDRYKVTEEEREHPFGNDGLVGASGNDAVNSPSHYTQGTQEAIEIIEEAIDAAPSVQAGMLQAQVLKYLLRLWHKDNPRQDAEKARWYLSRLINSL